MQSTRKSYNNSDVMDFWKDKAITSDGRIIQEKYSALEKQDSIPAIYDHGEPECMACGKSLKSIFENPKYESFLQDDEKYKRIWDFPETRHLLEKAHIIGLQFGGRDSPDNMVLLCKDCHKESPDTNNERDMLTWIYRKRKYGKNIDFMNKQIEYLKLCYDRNVNAAQGNDDIAIRGLHGGGVSDSTIIYAKVNTCPPNGKGCMAEAINEATKITMKTYQEMKEKLEREALGIIN